MERRLWQKTLATGLALLIVSGAVPIQPVSQTYDGVTVTVRAEGLTDTQNENTTNSDETSASHEITYTNVPAKEATCTENGNTGYYEGSDGKYYTLTDGGEYTEIEENSWVIEALGHDYAESYRENEVAPTYTAEGSYDVVYSCSRCGDEYRETMVVPMLKMTKVTINTVDINGIKTSATVYAETFAGTDYTLPRAPYLDGYNFAGWKVNGTLYTTTEEVRNAVETLVKAKTAVTVAVDYEKNADQFSVTVTNGTLDTGSASDTVQVSTFVKVNADTAEGKNSLIGRETASLFLITRAIRSLCHLKMYR